MTTQLRLAEPGGTRRIGIALSGGGSRGIAHIGVLRALLERGIRPDVVAGTSAGAIVGALYAAGHPPERILEFFHTKNPFRLSKISLTKPGIIDTAKVVSDFEEYLPHNSFEALERRLSVTATDIVDCRAVVFDSGPLIPAVLASSSLPMLFTPTEIGGRWFADGGIVNNFPVEFLEASCDVVLGVYASPLRPIDQAHLTTSVAVLQRSLEVGMYLGSRAKFERCDAVLCPEALSGYGTLDTKHLDEIEAVGYAAAREQMDAIVDAVHGNGRGARSATGAG